MDYYANSGPCINKKIIEDSSIKECLSAFYNNDDFRNTIITKYLHMEDHLLYEEQKVDSKFRALVKIDRVLNNKSNNIINN